MDFKTIDFREFHDLATKKEIRVMVKYYSETKIKIKLMTKFKGKYSGLLENFFNYPENKNLFENLKEGNEIELTLKTFEEKK